MFARWVIRRYYQMVPWDESGWFNEVQGTAPEVVQHGRFRRNHTTGCVN